MSGSVYAIISGEAVKIGLTRNSAESRLYELQTGNPVELKIWTDYCPLVIPARRLEKLLHNYLKASRIRGEWFFPTRSVMRVLEMMHDGSIEKFFEPEIVLPERVYEVWPVDPLAPILTRVRLL